MNHVSYVKVIRITLLCILVMIAAIALTGATLSSSVPFQDDPDRQSSDRRVQTRPGDKNKTDKGDEEAPQGQTAISVAVDLVSLQVLVTDTKGNALTGLKPENFTIYEDNVKQEISNFAPIETNVTVVLLVEYSNYIEGMLDQIWTGMYYFANSLRKEDWVAVMTYDMHTKIVSDFTQDRRKLQDIMRQFMFPAYSESNLSDAVIEALDRTQETEGKVAIVLLSTGLDTFSRHTYDEALQKCKEANASIYAIGLGQQLRLILEARRQISAETNMDYLMGENRLQSFAEYTGGASYFPRFDSEFHSIFDHISQVLRNQYSIAYASSNTKRDGKFRKIRVEVSTDLKDKKGKPLKLKVVTRKGYLAKAL